MMFGLPAAALAMYLAAPADRRPKVAGILFSVALTAFLTGVTEPMEFLFMFLAPGLYVLHAVFTGLSLVVTNQLGVLHGFGFSAGLFDMIINWGLATKPLTLILIGVGFGVLYFVTFYAGIRLLDLKTPGREVEVSEAQISEANVTIHALALQYLKALGGHGNLKSIDACITRLRLTLHDMSVVNDAVLKALGAKGIVRLGSNNLQIILGPEAEIIAAEMKSIPEDQDLGAVSLPQ